MITIVNRDIPDEPGFLYGKILEPLKQANINVSAISHPTEPQAIAVVVDANDTQKATQILHDTLNPDPK